MSAFLTGVAALLLGCLVAGLVRVIQGPTQADRMVSANLLGTVGVAVLLLWAEAEEGPALRDVALVLALLAAVSVCTFVSRAWPREDRS